ncbi:MAG: hypothetical protein HS108_09250 [Planctomycetes bacterium]|nr:hypothetical protein [Planctomycetota bacterium]MCL4729055.1 hypothetical protein [Planctomycetota bacterium]
MPISRLALLLVAPVLLLATGCDHHHDEDDHNVVIIDHVPAGGRDFGLMLMFDHDYADRDISDPHDLDGFEFRLNEPALVVITLTGQGGFDGFLDLYRGDFHFLWGDDNGGPGADAVLVGSLSAGSYFVVVGGSGGSTGNYSMDITIEAPGGVDFGVLGVPAGVIASASIADAADVDSFIFTVNSSATLDVFVTRTSGNYDGNLQILNEYGVELAWVDPAGAGDPAAINIALSPGTYMVRVGASSGSGNYTVQVDLN